MCGPVLPEQPPTQWNARAADLTTGALRGVIEQACLVNDFVAVGLGITAVDPNDVTILRAIPPTPRAPLVSDLGYTLLDVDVYPSPTTVFYCIAAGVRPV